MEAVQAGLQGKEGWKDESDGGMPLGNLCMFLDACRSDGGLAEQVEFTRGPRYDEVPPCGVWSWVQREHPSQARTLPRHAHGGWC